MKRREEALAAVLEYVEAVERLVLCRAGSVSSSAGSGAFLLLGWVGVKWNSISSVSSSKSSGCLAADRFEVFERRSLSPSSSLVGFDRFLYIHEPICGLIAEQVVVIGHGKQGIANARSPATFPPYLGALLIFNK